MGVIDVVGNVASSLSPVGYIAGGIGSLVSGISAAKAQRVANKTNLEIARQNNETAINIARENNQFAKEHAIEMFNLENVYNDPSKQVARLTAAGLNPAAMMETAGGTAVGNSSGSGMVSPSMPSLTTPHVEAVPPMAVGFLDALGSLSQIKLANAQARKAGAEEDRITRLVDEEVLNMMIDRNWKEVQTEYQDLMNRFEVMYGHDKRAADIQKVIGEFLKNKMQGNEAAARASLAKAEEALTNTKNNQMKLESPILIENLKKLGVKLDEEAKTEKSKQRVNYSTAAYHGELARLMQDQHDDLVRAEKYKAAKEFQGYREMVLSSADRLERLYNDGVISRMQIDELREAVDLARKNNDWYHFNQVYDKIERLNRGVNSWFSLTNY